MNLENRQQFLVLVAIAAVALLVGDRLVFKPMGNAWKERRAQLAHLRKEVNEGGLLMERESALRERWQNMQARTFSNEVSAAENQILKAFDQWSRDSLISVTSVKPQWRRDDEEYLTLDCRVDASGDLRSLTRFLYEMEKDPLALKIDRVEIISRDESGAQLALGLQVSGLLLSQVTER